MIKGRSEADNSYAAGINLHLWGSVEAALVKEMCHFKLNDTHCVKV